MKFYKNILKNQFIIHSFAFIAYCYIKFVYMTSSWKKINFSYPEKYWQKGKPFICVLWHNRLMMAAFGWDKRQNLKMLISPHSDGAIISRTIAYRGIDTISGSSNKNAIFAFKAMLSQLKKGINVGITPDGPRGPRLKITNGVIKLAQLSGCDIIPLTYAINNRKIARSWDKFIIPMPFSRGVLMWGKPVSVAKKLSPEELANTKQQLQKEMLALTDKADQLLNQGILR